jgi:hypothetical protein
MKSLMERTDVRTHTEQPEVRESIITKLRHLMSVIRNFLYLIISAHFLSLMLGHLYQNETVIGAFNRKFTNYTGSDQTSNKRSNELVLVSK